MGNNKKILIIIGALLIILFFFIMIRSNAIKRTTISKITDIIKDNEYTLFYKAKDDSKVNKEELKRIRETYGLQVYELKDSYEDVQTYVTLLDIFNVHEGDLYLVFDNTRLVGCIDDKMNKDDYIKKYLFNYIPENEIRYYTATGDEYYNLYNSKDTIVTVFGEDECSYCKQLEPVINKMALEYTYDIYYMNFSKLSDKDIQRIYDLNITIPGECTKSGKERSLIEGYSKPTTIVSKKGKIIGCIKGYYDYKTYSEKLKKIMEGQ